METVQGTWGVCTPEATSFSWGPNKKKSSADGISFGRVCAVETAEALWRNVVFIHEGTSFSKRLVSKHLCVSPNTKSPVKYRAHVTADVAHTGRVTVRTYDRQRRKSTGNIMRQADVKTLKKSWTFRSTGRETRQWIQLLSSEVPVFNTLKNVTLRFSGSITGGSRGSVVG
jgi:hypothetical protein